MLLRTLLRRCSVSGASHGGAGAGSLTESTATRTVGTKGIRRPGQLAQKLKVERRKRQRLARARDVFAKTEHMKDAITSTSNARDLVLAQLADQIFSKGHRHMGSAMNVSYVPDGNPATPLVALAGRGKVGKTSLLRSLFRSPSEVSRSNRQLRRDAMNFFNVGDVFNIVDLPGYGGTCVPWSTVLQHAVLLRNFVQFQPSLKMLYYCMDVHYKNGVCVQDMDMLRFLSREVPNFTIVLTKAEELSDNPRAKNCFRLEDIRKELMFNEIHHPVIVTSAYRMGGIDTLRFDMAMNCLHALPTERLTYTEAKRLSERLFSQKELATVRQLPIAPTQVDDELHEWNAQLRLEEEEEGGKAGLLQLDAAQSKSVVSDTNNAAAHSSGHKEGTVVDNETRTATTPSSLSISAHNPAMLGSFEVDVEAARAEAAEEHAKQDRLDQEAVASALACVGDGKSIAVVFENNPEKQLAYASIAKKAQNAELMTYVEQTSPWRNPLLWPENVIPTKHPKSNIMRCPEDPHNPYLSQPYFVAPRADMYFRRPNVGIRKASGKGRYEADRPLAYLLKPYTIPFFPDIVDTQMHPEPWTFLGSREAYYERSGGRQLGVRLTQYATKDSIQPLSDNPAPEMPMLTQELRSLEAKRYGAPIAMLRPPGVEDEASKLSEPLQLDSAKGDSNEGTS